MHGTGTSLGGSFLRRTSHMSLSSLIWRLAVVLPFIVACGEKPQLPAVDSPAMVTVTDTSVPVPPHSAWSPALGPVLVVPSSQRDVNVIFPGFSDSTLTDTTTFDTSSLSGMRLDLFSRGGMTGRGRLQPVRAQAHSSGCLSWPEARIVVDSGAPSRAWTVAFAANHARPIPLDSLESFTRPDSARLTVEVARMASLVPNDTAAAFRGIPFFVRQIRRFQIPLSTTVLVANITRRLNQEANPLEEQLLLVAEQLASASNGQWLPVYHERVSGNEEMMETTDVLAAIMIDGRNSPALVLIRDYGDGSAYALLSRSTEGAWRIAWSSAYTGC